MYKLLLIFGIFFIPKISACEIPLGTYSAMTESEYTLEINLYGSNMFEFTHKNWWSGDSGIGEEHIYSGSWECTDKKLTLKYSVETITGEYRYNSLEVPWNIKNGSKSLVFSSDKENKGLISGWVFWPSDFLRETFKDL
jgi:hypothetical protein